MDKGILYCVATPIGNLEDMTERARRILAEVDKIYAEDTRVTRRLLTHFGIQKSLESLHDHNESARIAVIQAELEQGMKLALVSDAGTPLISDPGYKLVHVLGQAGMKIVPIPGASALIAALSVAGLPTSWQRPARNAVSSQRGSISRRCPGVLKSSSSNILSASRRDHKPTSSEWRKSPPAPRW